MQGLLWHKALSKTVSKSTLWPQLHYIHQDLNTGEFAAPDNRVLLVERNGMPPLAEWWNPDGSVANVVGLEYVKYSELILKIRNMPPSKLVGVILPEQYQLVREFVGSDHNMHTSGQYQLYTSPDGLREALIYAYDDKGKWRLLNTAEELIAEFDDYESARQFGELLGCDYLIRRNK